MQFVQICLIQLITHTQGSMVPRGGGVNIDKKGEPYFVDETQSGADARSKGSRGCSGSLGRLVEDEELRLGGAS